MQCLWLTTRRSGLCALCSQGRGSAIRSREHRLAQVLCGTPVALPSETYWPACHPTPDGELAAVGRAASRAPQALDRPTVFHVEPNISPSAGRRPRTLTALGATQTIRVPSIFGQGTCASGAPEAGHGGHHGNADATRFGTTLSDRRRGAVCGGGLGPTRTGRRCPGLRPGGGDS